MTSVINWDDKSYHHQFLRPPGKAMLSNVRCKMRSLETSIQPKSEQFDEYQISKFKRLEERLVNTLQVHILSLISEQFLEMSKTGVNENMFDRITKGDFKLDQDLRLLAKHPGAKQFGIIHLIDVDSGSGFLRENDQAIGLPGCWKSLSRHSNANLHKNAISSFRVNSDFVKEILNPNTNNQIIQALRELQANKVIYKANTKTSSDLQALLLFIQVKQVTELLLSQFQALQTIICYIVTVRILVAETLFLQYKLQVAKLISTIKTTQVVINQISMDAYGDQIVDLGRVGGMGEFGNEFPGPGGDDADIPEIPDFMDDSEGSDNDDEFERRMQQGDDNMYMYNEDEFNVVPRSPSHVPQFQHEDFDFGNVEDDFAEQLRDGELLIADHDQVPAIMAAIPNDPHLLAPRPREAYFEWNNLDPAHAG